MGKFKDEVHGSASVLNSVQEPPHYCGCSACKDKADILFITTRKNGVRKTTDFNDVGYYAKGQAGRILCLRSGYTFVRWVARCGRCYNGDVTRYREMQAAGTLRKIK